MNRLSLYYDIAGRVTKENEYDKYFTVGGIIFPTVNEDQIKGAIP